MPRPTPRPAEPGPLSIVVLAAGQGKRMRSALPKVLQPLAGRPLLSHVLALADELRPASIHVVYGHGGDQVRQHIQHPGLQWALQAEQRGTGHAVQQALPQIPESHRVLVLYGDVPLLRAETLRELVSLAGSGDLALLSAELPDPTGYGRLLRNARGALQRIVEERDASARERRIREINTGVLVAPAKWLRATLARVKPGNAQGEYYLTDVIGMAVKERKRVATLCAADVAEIQGINDKAQLAAAEAEYRRRRAEALLAQGVTIIDPTRIDLRGEIEVGRDVVLDVNVVLEGPISLGDGVKIGAHCVLQAAKIGEGTVLQPHCVVQEAQIGPACIVGPFARVRPGSVLAGGVHVGNFVEIKNSQLGERSKVNHLSYVGDADVGSDVNVGAGTITCNYDGANKHRTQIGKDVFVGSGTMLVAPIKVGDGATIGAGSTLTADAPAGKLTLARSRQVTLEQWERPRKTKR